MTVSTGVTIVTVTHIFVDTIPALAMPAGVHSTFINVDLAELSTIARDAFTGVAILSRDATGTISAVVSEAVVNFGFTASTYKFEVENK